MRLKDEVDHCYTKQERWRLKKLAEGGCVQCGKPREVKEIGHCKACLEKKRIIRMNYKKKLGRLSWEKRESHNPNTLPFTQVPLTLFDPLPEEK